MRHYPNLTDKYEAKEVKDLDPKPWMLELLKCNPKYTCWGPHEDYMSTKDAGWSTPITKESWNEMADWGLDSYNECANFYFEISRPAPNCTHCDNGYTHEATVVRNRIGYDAKKLKPDELAALKKVYPNFNENDPGLFGHLDCLREHTVVKYICERDGIIMNCPICGGDGYIYEGEAFVNLILWMLHPRKGCSRGVEIKNIKQEDLPSIFMWLDEARTRNANRFSGLDLLKGMTNA